MGRDEPPEQSVVGGAQAGLVVDEAADVAPAASAAATPEGVLLVGRAGETWMARLKGKLSRASRPGSTPIASVDQPASAFMPWGATPAALFGAGYFALGGKLVRRATRANAELEPLVDDAQVAGRVVAPDGVPSRPVAGYLARSGDRTVARLWVEGSDSKDLSPEGAAASSLALIGAGSKLVAVSIEGRSGMTPLHARPIELTAKGFVLGEDEVVWVGGSAERFTSVAATMPSPGTSFAFVPLSRGVTDFGLARIPLEGDDKGEPTWRIYPNGVDPAPVATTTACGGSWVAYVRPAEAAPRSPQQLHLARVESAGLSASTPVAFGRRFSSLSLAGLDGGILVVYVADERTWAVTARCPRTSGGARPANSSAAPRGG